MPRDGTDKLRAVAKAFQIVGCDYMVAAPWMLKAMSFPVAAREKGESVGMTHGGMIVDRASFEAYPCPTRRKPTGMSWIASLQTFQAE